MKERRERRKSGDEGREGKKGGGKKWRKIGGVQGRRRRGEGDDKYIDGGNTRRD